MINNELKELPEKWYVKPNTLEEAKIVAEYFDKEKCGMVKKDNYYSSILLEVLAKGLSNDNWGLRYHPKHTEISFEQFKKWVLKEEVETKFIVGQWYKSTPEKNNRQGKTYYGKFLKFLNERFVASDYMVFGNRILKNEYTFNYGHIWEELTDLTEIQEFLLDNHPDKITTIMKSKKVEDLVYPDVIHLESQEQLDEILKYNKKLFTSFKKDEPDMLFGDQNTEDGSGRERSGFYNNRYYNNQYYNVYKFSDIIFPEKEPKEKSLVGRYLKALINYPQAGNVKAGEYGLITDHEKTSLEANFPSQHGYLCSGALEKNQTKYELMPEDFIPESNPETKKEPVVKLAIGNHYEITDFNGNKEVVEIVNIHTDIQKMNNLLNSDNDECNSTWNVKCTVCIYEYKRIYTTFIRKVSSNDNVTTIKLFNYFSDDSPFAKSAKLVKTNVCLYTLGTEGLFNNTTGNFNTALGTSADTATFLFSTNNESKIHTASSPVNSQYLLTPTIKINTQEETKIQIKFKKSIKI
jgi:hypothetical protein